MRQGGLCTRTILIAGPWRAKVLGQSVLHGAQGVPMPGGNSVWSNFRKKTSRMRSTTRRFEVNYLRSRSDQGRG